MNIKKYKFCPFCSVAYNEVDYSYNRLVCHVCNQVFYLNSKPTASALIIKDNKILLGVRAVDPGKGLRDVPGGFCDLGEKPEDAMIREVKEETNLDVTKVKYLGVFMDEYGVDGDSTMNFCFEAEVTGEPMAGDDVASLAWFDLDKLPDDFAFVNGRAMVDLLLKQRSNN